MLKMCEYKFRGGKRCKEEALPNSKYCILHEDLPEDEESEEFKRINGLKEEIVREKISKGDFNFEGAKLLEVDFSERTIKGSLTFIDAVIEKAARFEGVNIGKLAWFTGAKIIGGVSFKDAKIGRVARFDEVEIGGDTVFVGAEIGGDARFDGAKIGGRAWFYGAKIDGVAWFVKAEIDSFAWFDEVEIGGDARFDGAKIGENAWFKEAKIGGDASFSLTEIKGVCSFKDAKFKKPQAQEEACRTARKTQERIGDRVSADYYFYREMEAKRKQKYLKFSLKPILKLIRKLKLENLIDKHKEFFEKERRIYRGFLELPIQYIFGYGVHPWRVITTWLVTVFVLAFVYWLGHGVVAADSFWECLYFSIVTAATPGYGGYTPAPGLYQGLASFEAILGTFMWAAFIATFARKYMR